MPTSPSTADKENNSSSADYNKQDNYHDSDTSEPSSPVKNVPHDRLLTRGEILGLCLPAAAVQVGWTVGESLLIPYLLSLGVSSTVANFAWLINPLFGLFLQPLCGHASDNCSSSFGRRRPFLFLFHLGSVCGLLTVVFACQILALVSLPALDSDGHATAALVAVIFAGFATADMCHDLLLMPARALLNDQLPDEQTDEGNSYFALIASLGSIIGLCMVIVPLDTIYPLSILGTPIRATFVVAAMLVMTSNIVSFFIAGPIDFTLTQLKEKEEERDRIQRRTLNKDHRSAPVMSKLSSPSSPLNPPVDSSAGLPQTHTSENGDDESLLLSFSALGHLYRIVPRPLIVIWIGQFFFWYCVLHVNIWTTSYVPVDIFHAEKGSPDFDHGVRWATIGLLIEAVTAFCASSFLTRANAMIGITNCYHTSAIICGSSVAILWFVHSYPIFLVIMAITGIAMPAIYSSPFVLIEVHAADNEEEENEQAQEEAEKAKEHQEMDVVPLEKNEFIQTPQSEHAYAQSQIDIQKEHTEPSAAAPSSTNDTQATERPVKPLTMSLEHASPHILGRAVSYNPFSSSNQHPTASRAGSEQEPLLPKEHEHVSLGVNGDDTEEDVVEGEFDMEFLDEWRGVLTGFYNVTMVIAQIIVGLTSGVMIDAFGDIRVVFLWSGCILIAVHLFVLLFGLSKPKAIEETEEEAAKRKQEEEEERERQPTQPSRPPSLLRPPTVPALPPIIDYGSLSTRAGRLRGRGAQPIRDIRHASQYYHPHHHQQPTQPQLRRSRSAPALVLLSRPKKVIRGVPVFQSHGVTTGSNRSKITNERLKLERLRERTRLFSHLPPSAAVRRRHDKLRDKHISGNRPFHHVSYLSTQDDDDEKRDNQGRTQSSTEQKSNGPDTPQQRLLRSRRALTTLTDGGENEPVSIAVSDYHAENSLAEQAHQRSMWYSGMAAHQKAAKLHDSALAQYRQQPYLYDEQHAMAMHAAEPHTPTAIYDFNADDLPAHEVDDPTTLPPPQALRESQSVPDLYAQMPTPPVPHHSILNTVLNEEEEEEDASGRGLYTTR